MILSLRNQNLLFLGHWIDYPWSLVSLMVVLEAPALGSDSAKRQPEA